MVNHLCTVNHVGSSGSMEGDAALDLTKYLFNKNRGRVYLKELVSDNDSTMRSLLQHKANHEKDKLPDNIL